MRKRDQRVRMMLKRASTIATTTHGIGGRRKKGQYKPKPITLAKLTISEPSK